MSVDAQLQQSIDQTLQLAIAFHQEEQLQEAEEYYRLVLQLDPTHPEANHNMGILAVQTQRPDKSLPYFSAALDADPTHGPTWLNYIEALHQAGQTEDASQVLELVMQQGLQGDEVDALALRLSTNKAELTTTISPAAPLATEVPSNISNTPAKFSSHRKHPGTEEINDLQSLFDNGRYDDALPLAQEMTRQYPAFDFGWKALGVVLKQLGKTEEALIPMRKAAALSPNDSESHNNLGITLQKLGNLNEAEKCYRRALKINPDNAQVLSNLGTTLATLKRLTEAETCFKRAIQIKPDYAKAYNNLASLLVKSEQYDEAEKNCRQALRLNPAYGEAHLNLAQILKQLDRPDEAIASFRMALKSDPHNAMTHCELGIVLHEQYRLQEAEVRFRWALEIEPTHAASHCALGNTQQVAGRLDDAVNSYRQAIECKPTYAAAHSNLGNVLQKLNRLDEAKVACERAIEIAPDFAHAHYTLGGILLELAHIDKAEAALRRAVYIDPFYAHAHTNLLFLYSYFGILSPEQYLAEARKWQQNCLSAQAREAAHTKVFNRLPLTGRRLKVGYVSGDFRQHAISYFVEQLFTQHDKTRLELFAYSTNGVKDKVTLRLETLTEHWFSIAGMSDEKALEKIDADGIDILIDLAGHTAYSRPELFARRAAPVQAHYLGYFASTGLSEMDYWIGDEILTPPETDSHFSEQVWRLPRVWVSYEGKRDAPLPSWQSSQDGSIWLGSFNNLGKLTPATFALWAKVLHALPEGKLLLKTKQLKSPVTCLSILETMSALGITADRIELQDGSTTPEWSAHMGYYDRLDIALDPVGGVGGGTTTCDALWMGVPMITLAGDRMGSRMTASMLNAIGHSEWIAHSEAEYIEKVVTLARDTQQRKTLRFNQRKKMAASPLCDAHNLASCLEIAYMTMFEHWQSKSRPSEI